MNLPQNIKVLIAEDDPLVAVMVKGLLQKRGYVIIGHALDGEQVVEMAQSLNPDVILMDIEMPRLNGLDAAQQIANFSPVPIVVLTAYDSPEMIERASKAGVGAYLVKPPQIRELERAITISIARFDDMMELQRLNSKLEAALEQVKTLSGLLPICAACKKIRDDQGYWQQVEVYIQAHTDAEFTHGLCPDCVQKAYAELDLELL